MILLILIINTLAFLAWGKYLHHLDAFTADKKNEHKIFWLVITGTILNMILVFIVYPIWEIILYSITGLYYNMNPFVTHFLIVGPVEESTKFVVFIVLTSMFKSIKEPRDGILQAASVALGFALGENFLYAMNGGIIVLIHRSFFATLGHMTYSVIWGFAWGSTVYTNNGKNKTNDRYSVIPFLLITMLFHGAYNTLLDYNYPWLALFTDIITIVLFYIIYKYVKDNSPYRNYKLKEYKKAIPELHRGLQKHPNSFVLNKRMGVFNIYARSYHKAAKFLSKARKIKPKNSAARFYYGVSKYLDGDTETGIKHMNAAVNALPENMQKKMIVTLKNIVPKEADREELLDQLNHKRKNTNLYRSRTKKRNSSIRSFPAKTPGNRTPAQRRISRIMAGKERLSYKNTPIAIKLKQSSEDNRSLWDKAFKEHPDPVILKPYYLKKGESVVSIQKKQDKG